MFPSPLLRARVSKGRLSPKYVSLNDETSALSQSIIKSYEASAGKKKKHLQQILKVLEDQEPDYKACQRNGGALGEAMHLSNREPDKSQICENLTFREASKRRAISVSERSQIIQDVSDKLNVSSE